MFKRIAPILLLVPVLAAMTATSTASAGATPQWPQFRYGPARVGYNPDETTLTTSNVGTAVLGWNVPLPSAARYLLASPVMSGSTLYFAASKLIAVNTSNGHVRWQVSPGGSPQTEATPAIDGTDIFVAWSVSKTSGVVQSRSATTGSLNWSRTVPSTDFTTGPDTLGVRNGLVYFTDITSVTHWTLYALVESTGATAWSDSFTGGAPFTPPALNASVLVVGLSTGAVDAVNPTTGAHLWSATTPALVDGIAIGGTTAYVVEPCYVVALSTATGANIFTTKPPGCSATGYFGPAYAYEEVYVGSNDGHLYAINAVTGAITWTATTGSGSDPSVANGVVYRCFDTLQAFNASTGTTLLTVTVPSGGLSITDVDIAGGQIYLTHGGPHRLTYATMYKLP